MVKSRRSCCLRSSSDSFLLWSCRWNSSCVYGDLSSLSLVDADVDTKLNELKSPYTQEEFQRQLQSKKLSLDDLRQQLRRDLTIQKLFNKEITSQDRKS